MLHDADPVRQLADEVEVMGDEQACCPGLFLQVDQQIGNRGLNRHIQRGGDLVANHQLGFGGERPGNRHTLLFATRQLVRKPVGELCR